MRVVSAVALAYCLAFVVVCLGTCLAAPDEHSCCEKGRGFTITDTASKDCCAVTSGVCSKVTTSANAAVDTTTWLPQLAASYLGSPLGSSVVLVAPSPPLILRI